MLKRTLLFASPVYLSMKNQLDNRSFLLYSMLKLWFDVEKGYSTTQSETNIFQNQLWFDVEKGY